MNNLQKQKLRNLDYDLRELYQNKRTFVHRVVMNSFQWFIYSFLRV